MRVTADTVTTGELIGAFKRSVKAANLSRTDVGRDIRVSALDLTLNTVAVRGRGGRLDFQVPVIGMAVSAGRTVSRRDLHTIQISLVAPETAPEREVRDGSVDEILVDAIATIRAVVAEAAAGEDPFALASATIDLSFAVTSAGTVSLGWSGEQTDEVAHSLRLHLHAAAPR